MPSRALQAHLAPQGAVVLATGLLLAALSEKLSYGAHAAALFASLVVPAGILRVEFLRARFLRRALVTARFFRMDPTRPPGASKLPGKCRPFWVGTPSLHGLGISPKIPVHPQSPHRAQCGGPFHFRSRPIDTPAATFALDVAQRKAQLAARQVLRRLRRVDSECRSTPQRPAARREEGRCLMT